MDLSTSNIALTPVKQGELQQMFYSMFNCSAYGNQYAFVWKNVSKLCQQHTEPLHSSSNIWKYK